MTLTFGLFWRLVFVIHLVPERLYSFLFHFHHSLFNFVSFHTSFGSFFTSVVDFAIFIEFCLRDTSIGSYFRFSMLFAPLLCFLYLMTIMFRPISSPCIVSRRQLARDHVYCCFAAHAYSSRFAYSPLPRGLRRTPSPRGRFSPAVSPVVGALFLSVSSLISSPFASASIPIKLSV